MADNFYIPLNASGTKISAEENVSTSAQIQHVKLIVGDVGSTDPITGDATLGISANVKRIEPGVDSNALGKQHDLTMSTGDTGVMLLAVRRDSPASNTTGDGHYGEITTDANGLLRTTSDGRTDYGSRADTYTATAAGTSVDLVKKPAKTYSIQVVQTGTVTSWTVKLQSSLDGSNWDDLVSHTNTDGSGIIKYAVDKPALYVRTNCTTLSLGSGTNVIATLLAM